MPATRWLVGVHRRFAGNILGSPLPATYRSTEGAGALERLRIAAADPMSWRDLGWLLVALPLALLASLVVLILFVPVVTGILWWYGVGPIMLARSRIDRWFLAFGTTERLEQRVEVLTETRNQTLDHAASELRRIERDLHDGAQARLAGLGMTLGMAADLVERDPEAARQMLTEARQTSSAALGDLRDVVHGIHPPVLADRGLRSAIEALALDLAVPGPGDRRDAAAAGPGRVRGVLHRRRVPGQHRQARRGDPRLDRARQPARPAHGRRRRRRSRRCRPVLGDRDAGGGATARGVRRHDEGVEPGGRADAGHAGGAVRLVLAEDHALLRDGLIRILEAHDHEIVAAVEHADGLGEALADPTVEAAVLDVRLPPTHTDEGLRAAVGVRAERPGFPVMVLSQYVERIYARELLASGQGGIGYLLKDRVGDVGEFVDALGRVAPAAPCSTPRWSRR